MDLQQLSITNHVWRYEPPSIERVRELQVRYKLPLLAAKALATTNISLPLDEWFEPSLNHLHDPFLMLNMEAAVSRIVRLVHDQEKVLIVTDDDADGTMSCTVLKSIFRILRYDMNNITTYIPTRTEGDGFNTPAVDIAQKVSATVIITADIGVRDHRTVTLAKKAGIDVIICDHHLPPGESVPPDAFAVLCPPQDGCTYPNPSLAACGVCFKLAQALLQRSEINPNTQKKFLKSLLKVVSIGTVGDVVSLATAENRAIVALGAKALLDPSMPNKMGLQQLLNVSGVREEVTSQDMGFKLAPRINAAGRMADPALVERLLFATDLGLAVELARELDALNTERKEVQRKMVEEIIELIPEEIPNFLVITGTQEEGFHKGVSGIVAARLRDKFHRPVAVASGNEAFLTGSIRSIGEVHAVEALDYCADILLKYGGHPVAAGFSIKRENLGEFERRLNRYVEEKTDPDNLVPVRMCQVKCSLEDISFNSIQHFMKMEPFGKDNYKPLIWLSNVRVNRIDTMGRDNTHVRCLLGEFKTIWWGAAEHIPWLKGQEVDVLIEPDFNRYKGRTTIQLTIVDARISG